MTARRRVYRGSRSAGFLLAASLLAVPAQGQGFAQQSWTGMAPQPAVCGESGRPAIWTGPPLNRLIVWGGTISSGSTGLSDEGCSYDASTNTWSLISKSGAPAPRASHSAVWTGTEMLIWGGEDLDGILRVGAGARYNPATDTWSPMSRLLAPAGRRGHSAVWTGTRMIIWGGWSEPYGIPTGAMYDPVTNTWEPMTASQEPTGRTGHSGIWTGSRFLVWGGVSPDGSVLGDGALFDPLTNSWSPTGGTPPSPRFQHTAVWTGTRMIVWGGHSPQPVTSLNTGGIYDPVGGAWIPTSEASAPTPRTGPSVWTGARMIVWGGYYHAPPASDVFLGDGALFDPVQNTWAPLESTGAPAARGGHMATWTGTQMLILGGFDGSLSFLPEGGRWQALNQARLSFHVLAPCRLIDTRNQPEEPLGGPALGPGERRTFDVSLSACDVPPTASSIVANLAVTQPAAAGSLRLCAGNAESPAVTSLEFAAGRTRANLVFSRLATDGTKTVAIENLSAGPAHVILDVSGYFQ